MTLGGAFEISGGAFSVLCFVFKAFGGVSGAFLTWKIEIAHTSWRFGYILCKTPVAETLYWL